MTADGSTLQGLRAELGERLAQMRETGVYKPERVMASPQGTHVVDDAGRDVLNLCANNYLGLADDPRMLAAAESALREWGYGMASVRFICGTQTIHRTLEERLAEFLGTEDAVLFGSCFDANGGVFEALLDERDAVISDALNHASIIDGVRLCKAQRLRYANRDMAELEARLIEAADARYRLVVTDGVFSMDGYLAPLDEICALADRYDALVMVDDSHAVGFVGPTGRGTPELFGVQDRVDIVSGTLGKALGGASGGYIAARREIVELLKQRARPYLFSNSVAPPIVAASLTVLDVLETSGDLRERVHAAAARFRAGMAAAGFDLLPGSHPIVPVMFGDAIVASRVAEELFARGVYAVAFSFPVVPQGQARIRVQLSAAHTDDDVDRAVAAFVAAREAAGAA
ncbi:MAG TPA: glycine C-acetyltransferase [Candidatus Angelobacter sp.]|nr:glycine C-acetyltransferase [Candidatus Angelobacter sp.]